MKDNEDLPDTKESGELDDDETIAKGFEQMELLYKSRCVQAPTGSNVTVREIKKGE